MITVKNKMALVNRK